MALSEVDLEVQDGALGILSADTDGICCAIGSSEDGATNTLLSFGDTNAMLSAIGHGPVTEAAAHCLIAAGEVKVVKPETTAGTVSSVTVTRANSPASTGTVVTTGSTPNDDYEVTVEILTDGVLGTSSFRFSLDGQDSFSEPYAMPSGGVFVVPDTGITLTFDSGDFDAGDLFVFTTAAPTSSLSQVMDAVDVALAAGGFEYIHIVGAAQPASTVVTQPSSGSPPAVGVTGTPLGFYDALIEITTGGILGTAEFKYSLDFGATYTTGVVTAATVVLTGTGLTLTFAAGTYVLGHVYSFNTYAPITSLASSLASKMDDAEADKFYAFSVLEILNASDAIVIKATQNVLNKRVLAAADFVELTSKTETGIFKRPAAFSVARRISGAPVEEDLGRVASGPVADVQRIYRDEKLTPALDAARITTMRTRVGIAGFWIEAGRTLAPIGSDFSLIQYLRVMNKVCAEVNAALLQFLNDSIRVDPATGRIDKATAKAINTYVEGRVRRKLGAAITAVSCVIDETENILSTQNLTARVRVVPLGYARHIEASVGFLNPEVG